MSGHGIRFAGWGVALPDKVVTNEDLANYLDTSDEWIVERTGILERRVGGTTAGLATEAGRIAMDQAGVQPSEIDLLVLATTTADQQIPATASTVQADLGLACGAFDLNAACSGFVYALVASHGLMATGVDRVLLIGSETLSRFTDWDDRATAILFGDGAAAVVLERSDGPGDLLAWDLGSDGSLRHILYAESGDVMRMNGREVFRQAVRVVVRSAKKAMADAGVGPDDIALLVPHQANMRIIQSAAAKLGIPIERAATVLEHTANTSSASIPLALAAAADEGRIRPDDLVLMVGFGAGMTWASAVVRWEH